jgi:ubiquinone/menaquinone biosynthesis C-methylase UbiE
MTDFDQKAAGWDSDPIRVDRARSVAQAIQASIPISPKTTALEYGCGTGLLSFALQPSFAHVTLVDSSTGMLAVLDEKIASGHIPNMTSLLADFTADPLPPLKIDVIYTLLTLHHVPDTGALLSAFYSLLKSPGFLCVADLDQEDGSFHGPTFSGHLGFNREELRQKTITAGFRSIAFQTVYQMPKVVGDTTKTFPIFLMIAKK